MYLISVVNENSQNLLCFLIDRKPQLVSLLSKLVCLFLHVMLCMACLTCISIIYF